MAIYHLSAQIIGRANGKSAIAAAAYRAGEKLIEKITNKITGLLETKVHNYVNRKGVVHRSILAPEEVKKESWIYDREQLWNRVQEVESRKDAQFSREFQVALPVEFSQEENIDLAEHFVKDKLISQGMVADLNIHYDHTHNPHGHIMVTLRELVIEGEKISFGLKNRSWNQKAFLEEIRESWAQYVNHELEMRGFDQRITNQSHADRGLEILPIKYQKQHRYIEDSPSAENIEIIKKNADLVLENSEVLIDDIQKIVFTQSDLEKALTNRLKNEVSSEDMKLSILSSINNLLSSDLLVKLGTKNQYGEDLFTTANRLQQEQDYIKQLEYFSSQSRFNIEGPINLPDYLSAKQQEVIRAVFGGQDICIIEGLPGAGKTTVMKEIANIYKEHGFNIVGGSISSIATKNLADTAGIDARTIASWKCHFRNEDFKLPNNTVFVIDEAGMLDLDSAHMLFEKLAPHKIILLGDTNQFSAIGSKGALTKAVEICGSFRLDEVKRQENPLHRMASIHLGNYEVAKAFDIYARTGVLAISENNSKKEIVANYLKDFLTGNKEGELIPSSVMLAYRNKNIEELNLAVREKLKDLKFLGSEHVINLGQEKSINLAKGDIVLFCANNKDIGVLNGQKGRIINIKQDAKGFGTIIVDFGGRSVNVNTATYDSIKHGYAMTAHKSQGSTYQNTHILYEPLVRYEAFNVMMTRHQKEVKLYIDRTDLFSNEKFTDQMKYRSDDLDLVKSKLVKRFSTKESQLLAFDYLKDEKFAKIHEFIKLDANIHHTNFVTEDQAQSHLESVEKRNNIASEINSNIHQYKDYLAANNISFDRIMQQKQLDVQTSLSQVKEQLSEKSFFKEVKNWYSNQKDLREQAVTIEAKIIVLQQERDNIHLVEKQIEYLKIASNPKKAFEVAYKNPNTSLELFHSLQDSKMDIFKAVKEKPYLMGDLNGFGLFGLNNNIRKLAIESVKNCMERGIALENTKQELTRCRDSISITLEIEQFQKELSQIVGKCAPAKDFVLMQSLIIEHNNKQNSQKIDQKPMQVIVLSDERKTKFQKNFLKFSDIKLTSKDYINIFHRYAGGINSEEKITKHDKELQCGSLSMNTQNGLWNRFSSGEKGNIYGFVQYATGCSKRQALEIVAEMTNHSPEQSFVEAKTLLKQEPKTSSIDKWQQISPMPNSLKFDHEKHLSWLGAKIENIFEYKNKDGEILGYTLRIFDTESCGKKILPLSYFTDDTRGQWRIKGFGDHLYGAEKLTDKNCKPILIVEGEKTCDVAQKLLPDYSIVAFPGASRFKNIDWSALASRSVTIWPDNDAPGISAANAIKESLKTLNGECKIADIRLLPPKWDLGDKLEDLNTKFIAETVINSSDISAELVHYSKIEYQKEINNIKELGCDTSNLEKSLKYISHDARTKLIHSEYLKAKSAQYEESKFNNPVFKDHLQSKNSAEKLQQLVQIKPKDEKNFLFSYLNVRFGVTEGNPSWELIQKNLHEKIKSTNLADDMLDQSRIVAELKTKSYIEYSLLKSGSINDFTPERYEIAAKNLELEIEIKFNQYQNNLQKPLPQELTDFAKGDKKLLARATDHFAINETLKENYNTSYIISKVKEESNLIKQLEKMLNKYDTFSFRDFNKFSQALIRSACVDFHMGSSNALDREKLLNRIVDLYTVDLAKQFENQRTKAIDLTR